MSAGLIILVTVCYVVVAVCEWRAGNLPMVIVFAGYSFANLGLIMGAKG